MSCVHSQMYYSCAKGEHDREYACGQPCIYNMAYVLIVLHLLVCKGFEVG